MASTATVDPPAPEQRTPYVKNVIWGWIGTALNLFTGFFLSPYVIHKLGASGYGIWVLLFSVVGYYGLLELGVRSALVRYSAWFHARGEFDKLNELINTVIGYYTTVMSVVLLIAIVLSHYADRIFHVPPEYQHDF